MKCHNKFGMNVLRAKSVRSNKPKPDAQSGRDTEPLCKSTPNRKTVKIHGTIVTRNATR
jgi:hypothetical protein